MSLDAANLLVTWLGLYALIGVLFALYFVIRGAARIDPAASTMPLQARILIFPGVAVLWPLMLFKLFMQKEPPVS